jgi:diguanylate cyclase (GGDEF)-like protein
MTPPTSDDEQTSGWFDAVAYLAPVLGSLESGVLLIDAASSRIVLANETLAAMFGLSLQAIRAMSPDVFVRHAASLVDAPPQLLRDHKILPGDAQIVCEEFELARPSRAVIRWVARRIAQPHPAQIVVCTDITAEVDVTNAFERMAVTDRLTGLANRRGAEQVVRREMVRVKRQGAPLSIVMFDVDDFRTLNESLGHGAGDQILRQVARAISTQLRESDLAARWGGEEFLIVLPDTPLEAAQACAERIRKAVSKLSLHMGASVTLSGGLAQISPSESLGEVVTRAENRLREAKTAGRNRVC